MTLEAEVKELARSLGADLVGIASPGSIHLKDNRAGIEALLPGCRSLIVVAKRLNRDVISSGNTKIAQYDTLCTYQELDRIIYRITSHIKEMGFRAVAIPPNMPIDFGPEKRGMYGEVNQKCAATAAGLGNIGISRLLLSPEFGPFVRIGEHPCHGRSEAGRASQGGCLHKMPGMRQKMSGRSPGRGWFP